MSWLTLNTFVAIASMEHKNYFGFFIASLLLYLIVSSVVSPLIAAFASAKQMHRIPCSKCSFFTNDHRLKCTVKPQIANTETAINCCDYQPLA